MTALKSLKTVLSSVKVHSLTWALLIWLSYPNELSVTCLCREINKKNITKIQNKLCVFIPKLFYVFLSVNDLSFLFCCCNGQSALLCFFENVWYFFLALKTIPIFLNRVLINLPSAYFEQYKTQRYLLKFNDTKVLSTRNIFSWELGISANCVI